MNFPPVISRELQVQARQPVIHRTRWIAAGAVMGIWLLLMLIGGRASPSARAHLIFLTIGFLSLGFVMLTGIFQTADCLSRERRDGTLGLLFLTDLKGYDVVLGKLASTSLHSFYTFLAIVPVLALTFLMGGMTWGEFWRVTLVLVTTLYLSLATGMLVSVLSRDARAAMGGTIVLLLGIFGVIPGLWWLTNAGGTPGKVDFLLWGCPPYAFRLAFQDCYSITKYALAFWVCIATFFGIGTTCLAAASWLLPRCWQDAKADKPGRMAKGDPGQRRSIFSRADEKRRKLRGDNPLFWLATRDSRPRRMAVAAFMILLPVWVYFLLQVGSSNNQTQRFATEVAISITYGLHLIVKCLVAAEASRLLSEDRQSGTLELLLVAPLPVQSIINSQLRGIWYSFRRWAVILTFMNLAVILFTIQADVFQGNVELTTWVILAMSGGALMLFVDGCAIINVGMWMALVKKGHAPAFLATLRRVLLPPWLLGVFFFVVGLGGGGAVGGVLIIWFIISFAMNVFMALPALQKLRRQFRTMAALGYHEPPESQGVVPVTPNPIAVPVNP